MALRRRSSWYETEPVGAPPQEWFVNVAVEADTALRPRALLRALQAIESELGRSRPYPNAPRTVDLDILLYGAEVVAEPDLVIPHPRMTVRRFVLEPLAEIAPHAVHPVERRTIAELLAACPDPGRVRRLSPEGAA